MSDLLRLCFCPQCDYDLTGLPASGICPECGRAYDGAYVILRGRPAVRAGRGAGPVGRVVWTVIGSVAAVAAVWFLWTNVHDPVVPVLICVLAYSGLLGLLTRLSSPRPGEVLVWMSATGLGQQSAAQPGSWGSRLTRAWPLTLLAAGLLLLAASRTARSSPGALVQLFFLPVFAAVAWWGRPRPVMPGDGLRPPLYAWTSFAEIKLVPVGDRYRLVGYHDNWFARRQRTVVTELMLSPETATALRTRIDAFRK